ncbi:MAG TPA: RNA polymerase sigma factor [Baekduia sp.]|uniref:RNA polymerase sigma factor n=1 Tax=Baekduia sp. TaxID=2600305 RepID=UPI002D76A2BD|nr:RNA polymerase sigma factor [Baekduia sp.]HET6510470.1 RNA polymerase sigma factor [Baekduia sp.]
MTPSLLRIVGDERLARMVTSGNDGAFAALYDRYHDVLVRYCRSLVRDDQDALDAFQSTMLNALRALREDRRRAPVRPWLFRIAHNESISTLRRRPAAEPLEDHHVASVDVHRTAEDRETLAGLLEDLGSLTEHQRGALLLRELGGLAYEDVALALETTPLAARQAVFAARASLHDQREGRELPCAMVQRRLSDADRRAARTRAVRAHLRRCDDCRGFADSIGRRRRAALLLPIPPAFASSGLLASILDAGGGAGTVGGGAVATGLVAKAAVALSAAVVATGATEAPRRTTAGGGSGGDGAARTTAATAEAHAPAARTATATTASTAPLQLASAAAPATKATTTTAHSAPRQDHTTTPGPSFAVTTGAPVRLAARSDGGRGDGPPAWGDRHRDRDRFADPARSGPIAARPRRPDAPEALATEAPATTEAAPSAPRPAESAPEPEPAAPPTATTTADPVPAPSDAETATEPPPSG